ncbi:MAG: hypothetical protein CMK71_10320 [Pseudomonadaceae bacterium]|nr:hypothetical protein [Pseudomonadaceae bacterium]
MRLMLVMLLALSFGFVPFNAMAAPLKDRLERPSRLSPQASLSPLTALQTIDDALVVVGANGHVLLRRVNGEIVQAKVPVDLLLTAVHFADAKHGWVVGHDGVILTSTDAGKTWSKQLDGRLISGLMEEWAKNEVERLEKANAAAPQDADISIELENAYFALDDAKAGIIAGPSRPLLDVWFRNSNEGWAVGAYGMAVHTMDGGKSWTFLGNLKNPERLHLNTVLELQDGTILIAGEGGKLYRSMDGGHNWQALNTFTRNSIYKLFQLQDGRVYALGFGGTLFMSRDRGQNWLRIETSLPVSFYGTNQLTDGSLIVVGQGGMVLHSRDGMHFKHWQVPNKASLLGVTQVSDTQLAFIGSAGLTIMPLVKFREQLK